MLLFEIPVGTRKNFFEIYRQFGRSPSKNRQPWFILTEACRGFSLSYRNVSIHTTTAFFYNTSNEPEEATTEQIRRINQT
jgi:hypothetical protein